MYAIQQLLESNMLTHERFVDILKNYCTTSGDFFSDFFVSIFDLLCDHVDSELANLVLKKMYCGTNLNAETTDKTAECIRQLINLGGTLPSDGKLIGSLPDAIIEEYVDIECLDTNALLNCINFSAHNKSLINKCGELLIHRKEPVDKITMARLLFRYVADTCSDFVLEYAHDQKDFEWMLFDVLKYINMHKICTDVNLFPQNYVANKKKSMILMIIYQTFEGNFDGIIHPDVIKYKNVRLARYFATDEANYPVKYKHGRDAYSNLRDAIIPQMIIVEEQRFEEHVAKIYGYTKELLAVLEQDDELQLFIASQ